MKAKIRKSSDLPEWFKLADFSHLAHLGTAAWFLQLDQLLDLRRNVSAALERFKATAMARRLHALNLQTSDVDTYFLAVANTAVPPTLIDAFHKQLGQSKAVIGVRPINAAHRFAIASTVGDLEKIRRLPIKAKRRMLKESEEFFINVIGTEDSPSGAYYTKYAGILAVDMWLPDEILITSFRRWLTATRAKTEQSYVPRIFTTNDFARWYDDAHVPYCLLKTWADFVKVEISQPVLVEALFPTRRNVTVDQFRKTKLPNYEKWFRYETLDTLEAQAEMEAFHASEAEKR